MGMTKLISAPLAARDARPVCREHQIESQAGMTLQNEGPPISDSLLPSLQLRSLVKLKSIYSRPVPVGFQGYVRRTRNFNPSFHRHLQFLPRTAPSPPSLLTPFSACSRRPKLRRPALGRDKRRVHKEEQVRECRAKVRAIDRAVSRRLRGVKVFAAPAVELDGLFVWDVGEANGEKRLLLAEHAGATTKVSSFVFFKLEGRLDRQSVDIVG
jgi:hypothetical protein